MVVVNCTVNPPCRQPVCQRCALAGDQVGQGHAVSFGAGKLCVLLGTVLKGVQAPAGRNTKTYDVAMAPLVRYRPRALLRSNRSAASGKGGGKIDRPPLSLPPPARPLPTRPGLLFLRPTTSPFGCISTNSS